MGAEAICDNSIPISEVLDHRHTPSYKDEDTSQ